MNYSALAASNGSGEPVRVVLTAPRSIGSTTLTGNTPTNWPTGTYIATTGTLQSDGTLNPATAQVFYGTVSGSNLAIASFAAGYSDLGNSIGDVVVIKPTTEWANIIANAISTIYPVGTIYTETTGVNPNTTFGFGTWVAFGAGRVLVGVGTSDETFAAGTTGGESNHTLVVGEIPPLTYEAGTTSGGSGFSGVVNGVTSLTPTAISTNAGGGAHNNLQPYIVVYMWHRTA